MGLIKAALGSAGGVLADQWKEYFYCESIPADVLVTKGHKKVSGRSSNKHGSENIITSGSVIAVNDGQCMLIVEQGKSLMYVQNLESTNTTLPQNHPYSVETLERESVLYFTRSVSVLLLEVKRPRIREFTLSIQKN